LIEEVQIIDYRRPLLFAARMSELEVVADEWVLEDEEVEEAVEEGFVVGCSAAFEE
jgi:hypothetical protein